MLNKLNGQMYPADHFAPRLDLFDVFAVIIHQHVYEYRIW